MRPLLLGAVVLALAACGGVDQKTKEEAVAAAQAAYAARRAQGADMARGPCLGVIRPDWVADVAHDPRQPVDDRPENQCEAFRSGEAHHFVELDPEGNVIRVE